MIKKRVGKDSLPVRVNLAAWWRYRTAVTAINGAASQWDDQSGNMRHLLQATAAARPTVLSDGSLSFDGSNDFMQATFTLVQPCTVYLAFQQLSWTVNDSIFDGVSGTCQVFQNSSSPILTANAGTSLGTDATIALNTPGVLCFVANGATSVYQAAGGAASVTTSGNAGAGNGGGITLGATNVPGNFANIRVYEMAVFSVAHDAPTRLATMRYMGRVASCGGIT